MDEDLYDEFGNYKGPAFGDSEDPSSSEEERGWAREEESVEEPVRMEVEENQTRTIVLHEDKKYYPDAEEVFGPDTEILIQEEDAQPLTEPIIKPIKEKRHVRSIKTERFPPTSFTKDYMTGLMPNTSLVRNISIVGHLHHGKTAFVQTLVDQTHEDMVDIFKQQRFTDIRFDEEARGLSIKTAPLSLVLPDTRSKSYLFHMLDTPGHVNFSDEVTASIRLSDGVVLVVDVHEGVMINTERLLRHALQEGLAVTLVLNKIDRLILELKLPPTDAYYKIRNVLDSINGVIDEYFQDDEKTREYHLSPEKGNVCFASTEGSWSFTLTQFAGIYLQNLYGKKNKVSPSDFASRLWGEKYFDPQSRKFTSTPNEKNERSFVEFILTPIYKIYSQILGEDQKQLTTTLNQLGVTLTKEEFKLDVKPLFKLVFSRFLGPATGFVDMVVQFVPDPARNAHNKVLHNYTGPIDSPLAQAMIKCDPKGPLVIHVTKLFPDASLKYFAALGRVFSGTVKSGQTVKVLGENYSLEDEEDMSVQEIEAIYIGMTRYNIDVTSIPAGNWVLIKGIDNTIAKTATLVETKTNEAFIFKPLRFNTLSVVKIAIEPLNPAELPKMLDGIRKINKCYPLCTTKVEESGEHVIMGTGELYLDCVLYDLRKVFTEIEIKVSDPVVTFCETVVETSALRCFASTPNRENKLTMVAQPLEPGLADDIENEKVSIRMPKREIQNFFQKQYEWDILSARNIWAFGPDANGANILVNDCIASEVPSSSLNTIKDSIIQGFDWAAREGPLCEEPIRNVKFELKHALIADEPLQRAGNQIIPTARRVAYSAFLTAKPRLMEPIYLVDILAPPDTITAIYNVLTRRRGHVIEEKKREGSPLYVVRAYIPVIDSFGFETDLRVHSSGQAFCLSVFHHWDIVPGDPLDRNIVLRPLEDAPVPHLARDFMVKTRRRKGLTEDVSRNKFFDEDLLNRISTNGLDFNSLL